MFGLRGSVGKLSDIGHQLLQTTVLHGIRTQSIRVGGAELPDHKRVEMSLQRIYGIGSNRARQILSELNIENKLTRELTGREINSLREYLPSKYVIGEDLKRLVRADIGRLVDIQCYRGARHQDRLPCRGQRTHTNARTLKGKATAIPGKKAPRK